MAQVLDEPVVPGLITMTPRDVAFQRRMVLLITIAPFAGFVAAIVLLWGAGLSVADAAIALGFYVMSGLGITIGYHRYFTHGGFEASGKLRALLAICGSFAIQGSVISWVSDHRRHHAFADKEGDPHSPHLDDGPGFKGVVRGLWHAHLGWLFAPEGSSAERWAPDLLRDPVISRINRLFPLWAVLSFTLPALIGFVVTQSLWGAVTAFLWGSLARIFFLHHVTWSINSICHFYGKRPFQSNDFSTNNWLLSVISFGESWHNNHHAFPSSAVHGLRKAQVDISGFVIVTMEKLGLVRNVRRTSDKQIAAKQS